MWGHMLINHRIELLAHVPGIESVPPLFFFFGKVSARTVASMAKETLTFFFWVLSQNRPVWPSVDGEPDGEPADRASQWVECALWKSQHLRLFCRWRGATSQ